MAFELRSLAICGAAFTAFVNLYSPQALLPELAREFGVGAAEVSAVMTASTLAIALTAPFTGAVALGSRSSVGCAKSPCEPVGSGTAWGDFAHAVGLCASWPRAQRRARAVLDHGSRARLCTPYAIPVPGDKAL